MSAPQPNHIGEAWCSQHGMHPAECFDRHNPQRDGEGTLSEAEKRQAIILEHIRKQEENIKKYSEKYSRDPKKLCENSKKPPKR